MHRRANVQREKPTQINRLVDLARDEQSVGPRHHVRGQKVGVSRLELGPSCGDDPEQIMARACRARWMMFIPRRP